MTAKKLSQKDTQMCVLCGKRKRKGTCTACSKCLARVATYQRERSRKCKEAGVCRQCGKPVEGSVCFCAEHKQIHRSQSQARREKHRSAGLCLRCGRKPLAGRKQCARCSRLEVRWAAALRAKRRSAGLCVICGASADENWRCSVHQAKRAETQKRREAKRKLAGLCIGCGKGGVGEFLRCAKCRARMAKASQRRYHRNRAKGVCGFCGRDAEGKALCKVCRPKQHGKAKEESCE